MNRLRELLDRIGTPDAVSWPAFWTLAVLNAGITFATGFDVRATAGQRLVVFVVTLAGVVGFLLAFRWLVLVPSAGRPRPWATLAAFAVAGALRGFLATAVFVLLAGADPSVIGYRVLSGAIGGVLVLAPVAAFVSTTRAYRRAREDLLARRGELEQANARVVEVIEQQDRALEARLLAEVAEATGGADREGQAAGLERVTADLVRPLSHELALSIPAWEPPRAARSQVRAADVLSRAGSGAPLLPISTAASAAATYAPVFWVVFGPTRMLAYVAVVLVAGITLLRAANAALRRVLPGRALVSRLALVVGAVVTSGVLVGLLLDLVNRGGPNALQLVVASTLFYTVFGLGLTLARAAVEELEASLAELRDVDAALARRLSRLRMREWTSQRRLARALHGPVQSALAVAVDQLRRGGELDADRLRGDVREALDTGRSGSGERWRDGLDRVAATWEGLCEVRPDVDAGAEAMLDADPVCGEIAIEVIAEAVSNAVRHGGAQGVDVSAWLEGDAIVLRVVDDGHGSAPGGAGLGTRLLADCALGWGRESAGGRTTLTATLPVGEPPQAP